MMGEKLAMPARHSLVGAANKTNRVFRDKPGGLVVDYLGLAHELKAALATYTESGGRGRTALDQDEAVALMLEKYEGVLRSLPRVRLVALGYGHAAGASPSCPALRSTS
jgi:type I site-specific restriction-modification system R (restriction) subunit